MIDTSEALKILEDAHALAEDLNDLDEVNVNTKDRARAERRAKVSSDLLYLAHLCDAARIEVMNQYHGFRGKTPPAVEAPPRMQAQIRP